MKVDVEGTEREVIDGAAAVLRDAADVVVMLEVARLPPDDLAHVVAAVDGTLQAFDLGTRTFVAVDTVRTRGSARHGPRRPQVQRPRPLSS